ncbi:MAG: response regulator, partial [Verrucomicrobiaceae bacterium]
CWGDTELVDLVLVVEDEMLQLFAVQDALEEAGFDVFTASTGPDAYNAIFGDMAFTALVTDIDLQGGITGWDVALRARERFSSIPVVYLSGGGHSELHLTRGVQGSTYLDKPCDLSRLMPLIASTV